MPTAGESWNQFKLLEPLGKGGMGEVFLAEDGSLERRVALKFLPEALQRDETARERFLREARSAAALDHPYICKIYEIGEVEGRAFIAMEYIQGTTLQEKLRSGPLPLSELAQIAVEIGEAVEAAHKKQIIHRDLKTPNIMITVNDHVKVMDFGLAKQIAAGGGQEESGVETLSGKLTEHGATPGTIYYMSPEQVRGEPLDARSDIFSLGVVLYELATGRVPFQGATSGATYDAILNRGAVPPRQMNPEVPAELEQIIEKALDKDREHRYQTVKELLVDLKRLRRDGDTGTMSFAALGIERPAPSKRRAPVVGAGIAVALLLLLGLFGVPRERDVSEAPPIESLVVLPFENSRDDPAVDYLADGIAESLINQLSRLPQLSVMARSTAFRYRGADVDPQAVGQELGVGAVLTGRVLQQGDRLNVQAELVDAENGSQLWGEQYERELADLLDVQNEIASEISQALRLELSGDQRVQIAARGTVDSRAYQAYLRGRFLWSKRTNTDFKKAIEYFEEARAIDPGYARAYAGLADTFFLLGAGFYGADEDFPPTDAIAQARSAALEALRLDDRLAEPHATLGFIRFAYDWDWEGAEVSFLEALERDSGYATAHQWYGLYLGVMSRYDEAIEQSRQAVSLEPTSPLSRRGLASSYVQAGRYAQAIEKLEEIYEVRPNYPFVREWLMQTYWLAGESEKAISLAEAFDPVVGRAFRLAAEGQLAEARSALDSVPRLKTNAADFALYGIVGKDVIYATLERGIERRDPQMVTSLIVPMVAALRAEPRLVAIRERMGLP